MKFIKRKLNGTAEIVPTKFRDHRGFFFENFHQIKFQENLDIFDNFVQQNHSVSNYGVLRGMHFQKNNSQGKLVRAIKGKIFDVAVDLRKDSKTFCQWDGLYLDEDSHNQFWIPRGFAHGFLSLSERSEVEYLCTDIYHPEDEECLIWNDFDLNIDWPIETENIKISDKDANGKLLKEILKEL